MGTVLTVRSLSGRTERLTKTEYEKTVSTRSVLYTSWGNRIIDTTVKETRLISRPLNN